MDCIKIHIKEINLKVKWKWKELKKMKNQKKKYLQCVCDILK